MTEVFECQHCKNMITIEDPKPGQEVRCLTCNRKNRIMDDEPESQVVATPVVEQQTGSKKVELSKTEVGEIYKTASGVMFRVAKVEGNAVVVDLLKPCQITLLGDSGIKVEQVQFATLEIPVQ